MIAAVLSEIKNPQSDINKSIFKNNHKIKNTMANKIKSIAECGMQPTYFFEVGKRYPFPKGEIVTDIVHLAEGEENTFHIYNQDGLLAEMINCPVVLIFDQSEE